VQVLSRIVLRRIKADPYVVYAGDQQFPHFAVKKNAVGDDATSKAAAFE
jgi:hypothetical protein